jgi:peptidoglycan/LPS O-acetylase OafA/YrhL
VLYGFFAGVLLARGGLKLPAAPIAAILVAVVLVLAAPVPDRGRAIFDLVAALALLPLLVGVAARAEVGGRLRPILDGLAGLSYALYALHIPIVLGLAGVARQLPEGWTRGGAQLLAVPLALAAAWAAHRWFEPWAARLLRKRPQGFSTSAPSSSTR